MSYTTLEALKSFGGFEEDDEDVLLEAMIGSATEIINSKTRRLFEVADETDRTFSKVRGVQSRFEGNILHLDADLAEEASAITGSPTVMYLPENETPYYAIVLLEGSWTYPTVVTGYWAYSKTPPLAIQQACLRLSKWLYDMRQTNRGDAVIITPEGQVLLPQGLPQDIETILAPYVKLGVS